MPFLPSIAQFMKDSALQADRRALGYRHELDNMELGMLRPLRLETFIATLGSGHPKARLRVLAKRARGGAQGLARPSRASLLTSRGPLSSGGRIRDPLFWGRKLGWAIIYLTQC